MLVAFQANGTVASLPPIYSLLANIQIARARDAPKLILPDARKFISGNFTNRVTLNSTSGKDIMTNEKLKEDYYREAAQYLNAGEKAAAESGEGVGGTLAFLTRGTRQIYAITRLLLDTAEYRNPTVGYSVNG
jgi:RNA polymerase-associated protein CTR9